MKLRGDIKVVEDVEKLIMNNAHCLRYKPNVLDDIKSGLSIRQYVVDTSPALAVVKFCFDYRDNSGEVLIKDDKIFKLANVVPDVIRPLSKLKPYYHHRWLSQDELTRLWAKKKGDGGGKEVESAVQDNKAV